MNGMIDFYLQTCLGQSYFDDQIFADINMESLRTKKNTHFRLPPDIGKTPDFPSLCTASNKQIESGIQPAQVLDYWQKIFQVQVQVSVNIPWPMV